MQNSKALEVRYARSFLLDLKKLEASDRQRIQQFVFEDFSSVHQLKLLPAFRSLGSSAIFYRFTIDRHLVSLEITGQLVKFLRLLPTPEL
jgi:mRNA-degrading endonuclease RelE of RelBE toxin-antitoxin system